MFPGTEEERKTQPVPGMLRGKKSHPGAWQEPFVPRGVGPSFPSPPAPSGSEVFRMAGMRVGGDLHAELLNSPFPGNSMQGAKGKEDFRNGNLGWA